jgi:Family of unknown function (DUF6455)
LFGVTIAIAISLSVGAFLMRDINANASSMFDKAVRRLRNMTDMMDRLGFDGGALARTDLNISSAYRACQFCPADEVCHDWLTRAPKSLKRAPAFCPNAGLFTRAKQMKA